MKAWHTLKPQLFKKQPYYLLGCDIYVCIVFGIIGWGMKRVGFPPTPLILGVILGPLAEQYFLTSLANFGQDYTIFVTRPMSGTIIALTVVFISGHWPPPVAHHAAPSPLIGAG